MFFFNKILYRRRSLTVHGMHSAMHGGIRVHIVVNPGGRHPPIVGLPQALATTVGTSGNFCYFQGVPPVTQTTILPQPPRPWDMHAVKALSPIDEGGGIREVLMATHGQLAFSTSTAGAFDCHDHAPCGTNHRDCARDVLLGAHGGQS